MISCATSKISSIFGEVAEWLNAPDLKSGLGSNLTGVRIPPSPLLKTYELLTFQHYFSGLNSGFALVGKKSEGATENSVHGDKYPRDTSIQNRSFSTPVVSLPVPASLHLPCLSHIFCLFCCNPRAVTVCVPS